MSIDAVTPNRSTTSDVGETEETDGIQPRIEEAQRSLAGTEAGVVEEGDDGGKDGCSGRGTAREGSFVVDDNRVAKDKVLDWCEDDD